MVLMANSHYKVSLAVMFLSWMSDESSSFCGQRIVMSPHWRYTCGNICVLLGLPVSINFGRKYS